MPFLEITTQLSDNSNRFSALFINMPRDMTGPTTSKQQSIIRKTLDMRRKLLRVPKRLLVKS